MEKEAVKEYIA